MGRVRFTELEVTELGDDVALVLGRWQLDREVGDDIGGNFSLVFRRINGKMAYHSRPYLAIGLRVS